MEIRNVGLLSALDLGSITVGAAVMLTYSLGESDTA